MRAECLSPVSLTSHRTCTYVLVTEKTLANWQGTVKLHVQFYNRTSRFHKPHNENWHAHGFLHACNMATNASMTQAKLREAPMCSPG